MLLKLFPRTLVRTVKKLSEKGTRSCENNFVSAEFIHFYLSAAGEGLVDALEAVPQVSGQV